MEDLIDRQAAINAIEWTDWYHLNRNGEMVHGANSREEQAWYKAEEIHAAIENVPSAQPERKTGRWIDETFKPWGLVYHPFKCDQCGEHSEADSNYCPNCGAKMEDSDG